MENLDKVKWIVIIEEGNISGMYKNDSVDNEKYFVLDESDTSITAREFEEIATYVVDNFIEIEYLNFSDLFR